MDFDFADYTYSGLLGLFSAVIGMCYPLMIQAIDRIDEKYQVVRFVELFKEETVYVRFQKLILLAIGFAIIAPFALFVMKGILWMQMFVLVCHTLVVLNLLLYVVRLYKLILIYNDPSLFCKHLINKPEECLLEFIDLAKYAAKRENINLYNSCMRRVYELLSKDDEL